MDDLFLLFVYLNLLTLDHGTEFLHERDDRVWPCSYT